MHEWYLWIRQVCPFFLTSGLCIGNWLDCCAGSKFDYLKYVSLRNIEALKALHFFNGQNQDRSVFARNSFLTLMRLLFPFQNKFLIIAWCLYCNWGFCKISLQKSAEQIFCSKMCSFGRLTMCSVTKQWKIRDHIVHIVELLWRVREL